MPGYTLIYSRRTTGRTGRPPGPGRRPSTVVAQTSAAIASLATVVFVRLFDALNAAIGWSFLTTRPNFALGFVANRPSIAIGIPGRSATTVWTTPRRGEDLG